MNEYFLLENQCEGAKFNAHLLIWLNLAHLSFQI